MPDTNTIFRLVRIAVFGATSLFAVITIVLSGLLTNFTDTFLNGFFSFAALAIATGVLTLFSLPVMLIVSFIRKGAFTSMIAFEIGWVWFLWIMWLAVGGSSADVYFVLGNCSVYARFGTIVEAACNESVAITAFGFISWIFLMFYNITLVVMAFRQHFRGNTGVWTKDVTEVDFNAVGFNNTSQVVYDPKVSPTTYATQYPPVGTPIVAQQQQPQSPGSYIQPVSPSYPQSQAPSTIVTPAPSPYAQV